MFENQDKLIEIGDRGREHLDKMYQEDIGKQWQNVFASLDCGQVKNCGGEIQPIVSLIVKGFLDGKTYTNKIINDLKEKNTKLEDEKKKTTEKIKKYESNQRVMNDLKLNRVDYIENELNKLKSIIQQKEDYKIELIMTRASLTYKIGSLINVKFILIENVRSRWDINDHLLYLCNYFDISASYGISQYKNITTWVYDAPAIFQKNSHICFENKNIFYAIDFLSFLVRNGNDIDEYKPLYLLFNEFWYDIYCPSIKIHIERQL